MSTTFPTTLQDLDATRGGTGQPLSNPNHITHHQNEDDTIEALQAKVGVDSSAVVTTLDYKIRHIPTSNITTDDAGVFVLPGTVIDFDSASTPTGYLPCDGSAVSRTTYSTLFGILGTKFGAGNGSTTFNVPSKSAITFSTASQQYLTLVSGSTQYATKSSPVGLGFSTDFSIAAYIKMTTLPSSSQMGICCKATGSGNQNSWAFQLIESSGMKLMVSLSSNGSSNVQPISPAFNMVTNKWYHVAVSYTASTGIAMFYLDGQLIGRGTGGPATLFSSTSPFGVGVDDATSHANLLNGNIANLQCFNTALTTSQIQYTTNPGFYTTSIQGYWSFDNVYTDASGNGNTLTSSGSPVFTNGFSLGNTYLPSYIKT